MIRGPGAMCISGEQAGKTRTHAFWHQENGRKQEGKPRWDVIRDCHKMRSESNTMASTLSFRTHALPCHPTLPPTASLTPHVLLEISNSEQVWATVGPQKTVSRLEGTLRTLCHSFSKHIPSTYSVPNNAGTQDQSLTCLTCSTISGDWGRQRTPQPFRSPVRQAKNLCRWEAKMIWMLSGQVVFLKIWGAKTPHRQPSRAGM